MRVILKGNQFHETGFLKLGTKVLLTNAVVLKWRSYTESHETVVLLVLFHVLVHYSKLSLSVINCSLTNMMDKEMAVVKVLDLTLK
jgi:hypothetical protein